jgi:NADH:ubiquinone oxidoreductase subunit 4 (subunit M)
MISKELIYYYFTFSIFMLLGAAFLNVIFLVITRNFSSQDFFKNDIVFIFFKSFANICLLLVCIIQIFIFFFFVDYSIRTTNVAFFYDITNCKTQAFFYGKVYDYHFSKGLLSYRYSIDSFGLVIQFVGLIIGYISYIVLDTRFFYKNIKYLSVFCLFSVVVILFTTTNNFIYFFLFYELLLLPAFFLVYFLSQARRATQASLYFVIWTQFGSFLVLCATAYVIVLTGKYTFSEARLFKFTQIEIYIIFFLYFFGFGFKVPI